MTKVSLGYRLFGSLQIEVSEEEAKRLYNNNQACEEIIANTPMATLKDNISEQSDLAVFEEIYVSDDLHDKLYANLKAVDLQRMPLNWKD